MTRKVSLNLIDLILHLSLLPLESIELLVKVVVVNIRALCELLEKRFHVSNFRNLDLKIFNQLALLTQLLFLIGDLLALGVQ